MFAVATERQWACGVLWVRDTTSINEQRYNIFPQMYILGDVGEEDNHWIRLHSKYQFSAVAFKTTPEAD